MTPLDTLLGDPAERPAVVALSMLAALIVLAAVAWWRVRRAAACRPHIEEHRLWTFCPKCGHRRPDASYTMRLPDSLLPSDLLRQGWTRSPALDRDGRVVLPSDERAVIVAWSLWGAGITALDAGSPRWVAWNRSVTDILAKHHGGMSITAFNRHSGTSRTQVIELARDAERRAGLGTPPVARNSMNAAQV